MFSNEEDALSASPPAPLRMERGVITTTAPPPVPAGPSPFPSPEGKGSDHRDTPIEWI